MYTEGKCLWRKNIKSEDNEQVREDMLSVEISCCEYQGKTKRSKSFAKMEVEDYSLMLRTDDPIASKISQDDTIEWDDYTYSVVSIETLRSCAYLGAKEYIICLH